MARKAAPQESDELIEDVVERLDEAAVRRLLVVAADQHESVARAVRLAVAGPAERIAVLRSLVDDTLRTRRFLDYYASGRWADDARPTVDALAADAATAPSRELLALVERGLSHVAKVLLKADDSNGFIGGLAYDLLGLHAGICDAGVADPVALAKWMVKFRFDEQDFFEVDPVRYAAALGERGIAAYRSAVEGRPATAEDLYAATYAAQRLAILDGDVERVVALYGGDLSNSHRYLNVAIAMMEMLRPDDAVAWARRGIDAAHDWQVGKLYQLIADVLLGTGRHAELLELRREQHQRAASAGTYGLLRDAATLAGVWPDEIESARAVLAARDRGGMVDVFLDEGAIDEAWRTASGGGDTWDAGELRWARLAEAREPTNPAASLAVYLRLVDTALRTADRQAYKYAVGLLKKARRAAAAAELTAELDTYVAGLREVHRRRPTLIELLDKAKFTG